MVKSEQPPVVKSRVDQMHFIEDQMCFVEDKTDPVGYKILLWLLCDVIVWLVASGSSWLLVTDVIRV